MRPSDTPRRLGRLAFAMAFALGVVALVKPVRCDDRTPWTGSRMVGSPEPPPPYVVETVFPKLRFEHPVVVASAKGTNRLFVGEQGGKLLSFVPDADVSKTDEAINLATRAAGSEAIYGLAFHPRFDENRFVFVCYVTRNNLPEGTRVSRFNVSRTDPPKLDPESERILITWPSGGHNGGALAFGPEGSLYISTGDAAVPSPPDPLDTGQDVSDLLSSILRIDVDHEDKGRAYRVPADNPFVKTPGARPEIWAFGFRNPWKMSFDRKNGDLWVGDVGWERWELVDRVERGGNYGWSVIEGPQSVHPEGRRGPSPILLPTAAYPHSEGASVTGGYVYRGARLPALEGVYVYGDFQAGKVWGLRHDGKSVTWKGVLAETPVQIVSFGEDNAGELYLLDYERSRQLHRLVPNPAAGVANRNFPANLSETGLFASTRDLAPAAGVVPYEINAPLWSDHARAERWLALPGTSTIEIGPRGDWHLPEGSVLARTVSMERERGNAASKLRLETQVLHLESGSWRPYTYVWNASQTDATLADAEGSSRALRVVDREAPGGVRNLTYRVHARSECATCHNPWAEKKTTVFGRQSASPLGMSTGQFNREIKGVNQLREFERLGLFARKLSASPEDLPRTADPYDTTADLDKRARAYLQVNCAHCHQFGAGGSATIWLSDEFPLDKMNTVDIRPTQGTFGIDEARLIRPGEPERSVLFYRIAKLGGGRMPRIGSSCVDERGLTLLGDWIAQMARPTSPASTSMADRLSTTRGALALIREIDQGLVSGDLRREAIALGSAHASGEVRDLFERFVPDSQRVARLGETIDFKAILALKGDVVRGRDVFLNNPSAQCKSCHRLDGVGEPLGPDLSHIGGKYPRDELLRQIVEPSVTIDPRFATYAVATRAGQVLTGLLAEKTDAFLVLKDAQGRPTRIASADIDQLAATSRSLMPDLLLRDLTAQQAADLLEFLGSMK